MKCPHCQINNAEEHPTYGVLPCRDCQQAEAKLSANIKPGHKFVPLTQQDRTQPQRDRYTKDILQPWVGGKINPDFARAYPKLAPNYYKATDLKKL